MKLYVVRWRIPRHVPVDNLTGADIIPALSMNQLCAAFSLTRPEAEITEVLTVDEAGGVKKVPAP